MKINKSKQNALLFVLYASRAGRCTTHEVAEVLGLSVNFLEQITRKLRLAGVIESFKGPGGGYEVVGDPTVGQVFAAFGINRATPTMSKNPEKRALGMLMEALASAESVVLKRKVRSLNMELAANEVAAMNRIKHDTSVN